MNSMGRVDQEWLFLCRLGVRRSLTATMFEPPIVLGHAAAPMARHANRPAVEHETRELIAGMKIIDEAARESRQSS